MRQGARDGARVPGVIGMRESWGRGTGGSQGHIGKALCTALERVECPGGDVEMF